MLVKGYNYMGHIYAILLAYMVDAIVGDPRSWPHPVKWFGKIINRIESRWNKGSKRKLKGFCMLLLIIILTLTISISVVYIAYKVHYVLGVVVEGILIATTIAQKGLKDTSLAVYEPLTKGDLVRARKQLGEIVGRDTNGLSEKEIVRGTIETVAENTGDGITAPLFWAFIGGAPLALVYRAVNTCDSMVGYRDERFKEFGWASAVFDDIINFLPARLTAMMMFIINKGRHARVLSTWSFIKRDAKRHASPNSGWLEATVAYVMHVRLGGVNYYNGNERQSALLGTLQSHTKPLCPEHIKQTIQIMNRTTIACIVLIVIGGIIIEATFTWF